MYKNVELMDQLRPRTGNPLEIFVLLVLLMLCHPNISDKFYRGTVEDQLSVKHKGRTGECFL